ncbi:A/G-specific adenine glycosylase [Verticiella sediminum]
MIPMPISDAFAERIIRWQRSHGRHALPWQNTRDPYRIWLSEIMLQQTQVATVIPYYERFLARYPDVASLAAAPDADVMALWAGLGYYTRARNLHRCAREIVAQWEGRFPPDAERIATLPGIGRSTAAAVAAFAYGERAAILDGNVRRVFARHFGMAGDPASAKVQAGMWERADAELPAPGPAQADDMRAYTQGLMDLGATLCTRGVPDCARCPVRETCVALREARQHELPTPRKRKAVPERSAHLLWVEHRGRTLFERRPPSGIWGGLLSLPEFEGEDAAAACRRLGVEPGQIDRLDPFVHTFTHFRLTATPWRVAAAGIALREADRHEWLEPERLADGGLPAPIKKLLCDRRQGGLF